MCSGLPPRRVAQRQHPSRQLGGVGALDRELVEVGGAGGRAEREHLATAGARRPLGAELANRALAQLPELAVLGDEQRRADRRGDQRRRRDPGRPIGVVDDADRRRPRDPAGGGEDGERRSGRGGNRGRRRDPGRVLGRKGGKPELLAALGNRHLANHHLRRRGGHVALTAAREQVHADPERRDQHDRAAGERPMAPQPVAEVGEEVANAVEHAAARLRGTTCARAPHERYALR